MIFQKRNKLTFGHQHRTGISTTCILLLHLCVRHWSPQELRTNNLIVTFLFATSVLAVVGAGVASPAEEVELAGEGKLSPLRG